MAEVDIRPYRDGDCAAVYQIAADTAYFGDPVEHFLDDRRLFCDAFYRYYTKLEPEHGWVACEGGVVVGFAMGCADTKKQRRCLVRQLIPSVVWKGMTGQYRIGRRTIRYGWSLLTASLTGDSSHCDLNLYPAHLHINIAARYRGSGSGWRLMIAALDQLKQLGVPGVHLSTTSLNHAACHLYESIGFQVVDARWTRIWDRLVGNQVENRIYALRLDRFHEP